MESIPTRPMLLFPCNLPCRLYWVWSVLFPGFEEACLTVTLGLDAFTDLVCAGIPIFVILRLQMNMRTKIALCVLMGLGILWVVTNIIPPSVTANRFRSTACCAIAKAVFLKALFADDYTCKWLVKGWENFTRLTLSFRCHYWTCNMDSVSLRFRYPPPSPLTFHEARSIL